MGGPSGQLNSRRHFLRLLAASPALPYLTLSPSILSIHPGAVQGGA